MNRKMKMGGNGSKGILPVRKIPYPYRSMMAVCSDLDETPDKDVYFSIARFLNTTRKTPMGNGVGLEVGNTIYFDMPKGQFSYWNTDDAGRSMIHDCIQSGHIDCLHSYGDHAAKRTDAQRAIDALVRQNCRLEVWIDHATAPTNFGPDIMQGQGDLPGSDAYHADISCAFGIQFVWMGRVTSMIGQEAPWSLKGILNPRRKAGSCKTILKELAKGVLAAMGSAKYAMHRQNRLLRETRLRDGRHVLEFMRANPHWGGVSCGETADGIAHVLVPAVLDQLVRREGVCILYTHLGKVSDRNLPFSADTVKAFRRLADYYLRGKILVAATHRVLKYSRALRQLSLKCRRQGGHSKIDIETSYPNDLDGLTVYTPEPEKALLRINGREVGEVIRNPPDHTGCASVSLPWKRLTFPGH